MKHAAKFFIKIWGLCKAQILMAGDYFHFTRCFFISVGVKTGTPNNRLHIILHLSELFPFESNVTSCKIILFFFYLHDGYKLIIDIIILDCSVSGVYTQFARLIT